MWLIDRSCDVKGTWVTRWHCYWLENGGAIGITSLAYPAKDGRIVSAGTANIHGWDRSRKSNRSTAIDWAVVWISLGDNHSMVEYTFTWQESNTEPESPAKQKKELPPKPWKKKKVRYFWYLHGIMVPISRSVTKIFIAIGKTEKRITAKTMAKKECLLLFTFPWCGFVLTKSVICSEVSENPHNPKVLIIPMYDGNSQDATCIVTTGAAFSHNFQSKPLLLVLWELVWI